MRFPQSDPPRIGAATGPSLSKDITASGNRAGILAMLAAMVLFVIGDTMMKHALEAVAAPQAIALRGIVVVPFIVLLAYLVGGKNGFAGALSAKSLVRACLEIAIVYTFLYALARMSLANVTAIAQTTPLFITAIVVALGLENVGIRRWLAVVAGFCGVLFITRPDINGFDTATLAILVSAFLVAARDLLTRTIAGAISPTAISVTSSTMVSASGVIVCAGTQWQPVSAGALTLILATGFVVVVGNLMMILASRLGEVAVTTPYRYSIMPMGILATYLFWGEIPDFMAVIGMAIIVAAGLYTYYREIARGRLARPKETDK
jgi:drug/metabolite transporter (DMT)-like permease